MVPGHWEGDLIKGKNNASAVGTLVERTSGYLMLVKMNDVTATSAVEGFSAALNRMPLAVRKTMTYDQGREITVMPKSHRKQVWLFIFATLTALGSAAATKILTG